MLLFFLKIKLRVSGSDNRTRICPWWSSSCGEAHGPWPPICLAPAQFCRFAASPVGRRWYCAAVRVSSPVLVCGQSSRSLQKLKPNNTNNNNNRNKDNMALDGTFLYIF